MCNNSCQFFQLLQIEDDGSGLSRINFKCTKLNIEASIKVNTFNRGYILYNCPLNNDEF